MVHGIKGYAGKQLRIDLASRTFRAEPLDPNVLQKYLGGVAYGARLLYDELGAGVDPLSPENKIVVATGPLSLNKIPGGGSLEICFKSPATGGWGEARVGTDLAEELKKAGYDFVIIEGRADAPIILSILDGRVSFFPASHLLGLMTSRKAEVIRQDLGDPSVPCMVIGPAGERLVRFASVMFDDRACGRGGAGAVMGSKNLLGVAVRGHGTVEPADPEAFARALKAARAAIRENPASSNLRKNGTMGDYVGNSVVGDFPTKNWQSNSWDKAEDLYDHYVGNNLVRNGSCYRGCPVACGRIVEVKGGRFETPRHGGAEYESLCTFTAYVLNEDMDAAIRSTYLCNEFGIDTISTGAAIGFAMEAYEKGLLGEHDPDRLDLRWGNSDLLPILVEKISLRQGLGDLLADGVKAAAAKIGGGAADFAVHVKGLEGPAHDPRSGKALALTYGTANRGMCHIHPVEAMAWDCGKANFGLIPYGLPDPQHVDPWAETGKGPAVKLLQEGLMSPDILGTCKFMMYVGLTLDHWAALLSALTGWTITGTDLLRVSERATNLQRLFNLRSGMSRDDDLIPPRAISRPLFGAFKDKEGCVTKDYPGMLREYYLARGWDERGIPTPAKLAELEIVPD